MKWTDKQQKVIDTRDRNILVSAAAGSGKTAVLVCLLYTSGFINSALDNEIFDNKQNEIAQAIADAIIDTLYDRGIHANDCKPNNSQSYSVQVGAFRNRQLAESLNLQLRSCLLYTSRCV